MKACLKEIVVTINDPLGKIFGSGSEYSFRKERFLKSLDKKINQDFLKIKFVTPQVNKFYCSGKKGDFRDMAEIILYPQNQKYSYPCYLFGKVADFIKKEIPSVEEIEVIILFN